jgi:hypothetical protein
MEKRYRCCLTLPEEHCAPLHMERRLVARRRGYRSHHVRGWFKVGMDIGLVMAKCTWHFARTLCPQGARATC